MRFVAVLCLLWAACVEQGPRDRSLIARVQPDLPARAASAWRNAPTRGKPSTSVIGLLPDPLAAFYPEDAGIVVRFDDFVSLQREALPRLREVQKLLPGLRLPVNDPADGVRHLLGLPASVAFDPARPFAFVLTSRGWAAIVPTRNLEAGGRRLKPCDGTYCVAGEPAVVAAYEPGFRRGFYLPGDVSVIANPHWVPTFATAVADLLEERGVPAGGLRDLPDLPEEIERVDLAVRIDRTGLRVDVRLAPNRESPTAVYLERMRPSRAQTVQWLPPDATLYLELASAPLEWEGLVLNLLGAEATPRPTPELRAMQRLVATLGQDAGAMLDLDAEGRGTALVFAELVDPSATTAFFESSDLRTLLTAIAGPEGRLEWNPDALERHGVTVGSITGHISRSRLEDWRRGGLLDSTLSVYLRGPAVAYVAIVGRRLCVAAGPRARADMERFLDRIQLETPGENEHLAEAEALFHDRLASGSVNLAELFDGTREAAPLWHERGRALKGLQLRWRIPASFAVTSEGGALRAAVRVAPKLLADAVVKIRDTMAK